MKKPTFVPRLLPLMIAASLFPVTAGANEPTPLATVVVEGAPETLAPTGVEVTNLPSLRAATSDTASLLRDVPGVSLYGAGGVSSLPSIHGLADDRLRIKVDGMDLISACGNHMNPALSYMDPSNVGSIEVFSGIAPVSVGGDSIGGAILVESAAPEFAAAGQGMPRKGEAGVFYRSNGNAVAAMFRPPMRPKASIFPTPAPSPNPTTTMLAATSRTRSISRAAIRPSPAGRDTPCR